jgi:hypothetical protein
LIHRALESVADYCEHRFTGAVQNWLELARFVAS